MVARLLSVRTKKNGNSGQKIHRDNVPCLVVQETGRPGIIRYLPQNHASKTHKWVTRREEGAVAAEWKAEFPVLHRRLKGDCHSDGCSGLRKRNRSFPRCNGAQRKDT